MPQIHPSAIVDPKAQIADDVQIGPGCVIDGAVTIGPGCRLIGNVYLNGKVTLGRNNTLYPFVCVGFEAQHRKVTTDTAGVQIGDDNQLRESVTVHSSYEMAHPTTVGNRNLLMNNSHVGHDAIVGNDCTLAPGVLIGGHAQLFDGVNIGGNGGVHQFCRVGRMSFIGGISAATKDVPPFVMLAGVNQVVDLNRVGLRRSGVSRAAIDELGWAMKILYMHNHTLPVAANEIEQRAQDGGEGATLLNELVAFIRSTQRGLCTHAAASSSHRIQR